MKSQYVDLVNLAGGSVQEIFQRCLQEVLLDIINPNKESDAAREITIKLKIVPESDRKRIEIFPTFNMKFGPTVKFSSIAYIGNDPEIGMVASEVNTNQPGLFDDVTVQNFLPDSAEEDEE